jgi:hypothetical protein
MKPVVACVCLALFVGLVAAQDRLPQDEARRYARACVEQLGEAQLDPDKAVAVRGEGGGAMVVPDKKLSPNRLVKAGQGMVPVGQLWLRKWTVVVGGKAVPKDRLRVVTVNLDDKDRPMPLLLLSVRTKGDKGLELIVRSKDENPLLTLPLRQVDFVQKLPLELEWQRGEGSVDSLTLTVLGKYQAVLPVTRE